LNAGSRVKFVKILRAVRIFDSDWNPGVGTFVF